MTLTEERWIHLSPLTEEGYLCYCWSTTLHEIPVRRVERIANDPNGGKSEPNYETGTYGYFACCEWPARSGCVNDHRRYIFFRTKDYARIRPEWGPGCSYIVGYYEVSQYVKRRNCSHGPCYALRASTVWFVSPENAVKLDGGLYRDLFGKEYPNNFRAPRKLDENAVRLLLKRLSGDNAIDQYVEIHRDPPQVSPCRVYSL